MRLFLALFIALFFAGCSTVTTGKDGVPKQNSIDVNPDKISALSAILKSWIREEK